MNRASFRAVLSGLALSAFLAILVPLTGCRSSDPPTESWPPKHPPGAPAAPTPAAPAPVAYAAPPPPPMPSLPPPLPAQPAAAVTIEARADGGSVNGDPRGPQADKLNAVLQSSLPALKRCFESYPDLPPRFDADVQLNYRVLPTGRTSGVRLSGQVPPSIESCLVGVFQELRFPEFEGPDIGGSYPVGYHREPPRLPGAP